MKLLLDTNICIYTIRQNPPDIHQCFMSCLPGDVGISAIAVAELQYGVARSTARERNQRALESFLLPLDVLPFDTASALTYGYIRAYLEKQGKPIGSLDTLIAAQAVAHRLLLITHNLREFQRVPGIQCETWVQ